jgi:hypothetical protein
MSQPASVTAAWVAISTLILFSAVIVVIGAVLITRSATILNRCDEIVDRDHGPALPPEPAHTTVIEVVEPRQETPVTDPGPKTQPDNLPAQKPRRPRPRPAPTVPDNLAVAAGTQAAEAHANDDPFLVAYRAELDRQVEEARKSWENVT